MPAKKPAGLNTRHDTAAERAERATGEASMRPAGDLPMKIPREFKKLPVAADTWRRLMRLYCSTEAQIVTAFDRDLLLNLCELAQELSELRAVRASYLKAMGDIDTLIKLDARMERKRALMHAHMQSLYLTPRARAGVAPGEKETPPPPDEFEQLLGDVTEFVNAPKDER
jgi:hypothetical protein